MKSVPLASCSFQAKYKHKHYVIAVRSVAGSAGGGKKVADLLFKFMSSRDLWLLKLEKAKSVCICSSSVLFYSSQMNHFCTLITLH